MDQNQIEQMYPSKIEFFKEVTGNEPLPRSTNIEAARWSGSANEYPLLIKFFGYVTKSGLERPSTGYVYKAKHPGVDMREIWYQMVAGKDAPDISTERRSSGRVFHELVKNNPDIEYKKVF